MEPEPGSLHRMRSFGCGFHISWALEKERRNYEYHEGLHQAYILEQEAEKQREEEKKQEEKKRADEEEKRRSLESQDEEIGPLLGDIIADQNREKERIARIRANLKRKRELFSASPAAAQERKNLDRETAGDTCPEPEREKEKQAEAHDRIERIKEKVRKRRNVLSQSHP